MDYKDWLFKKQQEWENEKKGRQSTSAFARYLDVKQSSLSQWMAGNYPPTGENVIKIASKLGKEIYDVLGIPRPPDPLEGFSPEVIDALEGARLKIITLGITDPVESSIVLIEALKNVGHKLISK